MYQPRLSVLNNPLSACSSLSDSQFGPGYWQAGWIPNHSLHLSRCLGRQWKHAAK